ncbi:MAG TPA: DinB family protein [Alphaproteobacteria bacterium]|nr:DinB family protein [Alphaproteobacteria bacterium]
MSGLAHHFLEMARNNAWANHRLYEACAQLSDAELKARRTSFFPSIHTTLNHILIIDWYYIDALEEGGRGPAAYEDELPFDRFDALRAAQVESDRKLIAFCEGLDDAGAARHVTLERAGGKRYRETVGAVLAHLYQHQIHHRGQVHAMLSGTSVPPPQLDEYFLDQDAPLRADDLKAAGLPVQ